jgi:Uncharacterized protein conserved in bacteria
MLKKILLFVAITFTHTLFCENNIIEQNKAPEKQEPPTPSFKLGLESITDQQAKNMGTVALITNQTGLDQNNKRNIDIFLERGIKLKKIFTPEHGLTGKVSAGEHVSDDIDEKTKIPAFSLYGTNKTKALSTENLNDIDTIIFDMQDAGMRHYTYITTLFQAIDAASQFNKKLIVLDRPNLLGPIMEGPLVEKEFKSTVSFAPVPVRHGMTFGELGLYYNKYIIEKPANLEIISMQNYDRDTIAQNYKLLTPLSPNITNLQACHGYSFLGLLGELSPINVGVGTENAFQVMLLSDKIKFSIKKWQKLQKILNSYNVQSEIYRLFDSRKNNYHVGLKIKIPNISNTKTFKLLIDILKFFHDNNKNNKLKLNFSGLFNKAIGTDKLRKYLENKISFDSLKTGINTDLRNFYEKSLSCALYQPFVRPEYL